ncbi:hypothetical protein C2G38_2237532 [Gigaspora rosea]|uniref:Uncharacterized protein n=1 Tax=Gigaspora rosea TaxID=44941 RepID=A0A397TTT7_9GLOM|nr:hypothetical protein C2G38_2237532 [Gigaspora rosea]
MKIKKQFVNADKIAENFPDFMYTSKMINTQNILNSIKASRPIESIELPNY